MDLQGFEAYGARPRRPPLRFEDYEVNLHGLGSHWRGFEKEQMTHMKGAAEKTTLTSQYSTPIRPLLNWDAALHESDACYAPKRLLHDQEEQLAHQLRQDRGEERSRDHLTPSYGPRHETQQGTVFRTELEEIQRERRLLQKSCQRMSADLEELKAVRADMQQLVSTTRSFQQSQEASDNHLNPVNIDEDDDWPPPPPPLCDGEETSNLPVIERLNRLMSELQVMKDETLAVKQNQSTPDQLLQAASALRPTRARHPIYAPAATPLQTPAWSGVAPAPPRFTSTPYEVPVNPPARRQQPVQHPPPPQRPLYTPRQMSMYSRPSYQSTNLDTAYRGPRPTIPHLSHRDPGEFAHLKIALENLLPPDSSELFKYQVLTDHLKLEEAKLIADAYLHSQTPFTDTMMALNEKFGQPHQLALKRIATVMDSSDIRRGDVAAFERFSLQIQALVGMLKTLGADGEVELQCGSHVARLLSKLPPEQRAEFRRCMFSRSGNTYTLNDLAEWLKYESWCQDFDGQLSSTAAKDQNSPKQFGKRPVTVLHGSEITPKEMNPPSSSPTNGKPSPYCAFCDNREHHLSQCAAISKLNKDQLTEWIKSNKRCWRCARSHQAAQCNLKKLCRLCNGRHLQVLHDVNTGQQKGTTQAVVTQDRGEASTRVYYLDRPTEGSRILLKVVPVSLHHGSRTLDTYAVLDDGSERTMLLPTAAQKLGLQGTPETLALRTIRQDTQTLQGDSVSFLISTKAWPKTRYRITNAFTAARIDLADHTYPIESLQKKYKHLSGLPLQQFKKIKPLLLIGSDHPHLVTPTEPVRLGPPGGPAAINTRLGWTLQGPSSVICRLNSPQQCLLTSVPPQVSELMKHVEKLWQTDVIPLRSSKVVTRSQEDNLAVSLLEDKTTRVEVDGIMRYATPLLRRKNMPRLQATPDAVMSSLRGVERRLQRDPEKAKVYRAEMEKLIQAGSVVKLDPSELNKGDEVWYIPHHLVSHNGKHRLVFNCSLQYRGHNLNDYLLPGPTLGASLLGVLLRFREHAVAISGDIKGMFHQVRLLPEDRPLLRFVWRDLHQDEPAAVYEWQVLPFGTTCSPCCATFAVQRHTRDNSQPEDEVRNSIEKCFYVDNCLQSLPSTTAARDLVDKLRALLSSAGFVLRQWASNEPSVISHLPEDARSNSAELWLAQDSTDSPESTLGLRWHFSTDRLGYKHRPVQYGEPTMRNIYKVLASQYDPLGFILPYTTRAKMLVRCLWDKHRGWDDTQLPPDLVKQWRDWEEELRFLPQVSLTRPYLPKDIAASVRERELHIFCDASEQAYGAVVYLRMVDDDGTAHLAFVLARSRVAPRRLHSMPRLELCGALTGAQLSKLLSDELRLEIKRTVMWTDSTTVLTWLRSESCRFKVFVGTRVAEIQELTDQHTWRYVDSPQNPADDITRGKALQDLVRPNRWSQGPPFLLRDPKQWPEDPTSAVGDPPDATELRKSTFCGVSSVALTQSDSDLHQYSTWKELLQATVQELHGAATEESCANAEDYRQAERFLLSRAQRDSFPEELRLLKAGKPVQRSSRLLNLSPELDDTGELIRVGGRLRRSEDLIYTSLHPVALDPSHPVTCLLIQDFDSRLRHPGPERVFAEIRRTYWILRGREAVRRFQRNCAECRRWKAKPTVPRMADLPVARLRLFKPVFHSTGVDCFGPFVVKVGRRTEKRWGIIFKCLTVRAVHLDVLTSIDTDSFLMALRRFIARRGTPAELYSDQGTNFKGGERELSEAFAAMSADLQLLLAPQKIHFHFNPPAAPHFGGVWEREIRSVKTALYTTVGAQPLQEEVLRTVLIEVEGILNSKPLGYVPSDVSDPDPVTPNCLLMGRPGGSLPQIVYPKEELLSRRRWKHAQVLADHFWARFIRLYLPGLQARPKWQSSPADVTEGSVAMIVDPQLPRALWPTGHIVKVHPSPDGHIRSADVKVKDRTYTRPVARLVILPALPAEDDSHPLSNV